MFTSATRKSSLGRRALHNLASSAHDRTPCNRLAGMMSSASSLLRGPCYSASSISTSRNDPGVSPIGRQESTRRCFSNELHKKPKVTLQSTTNAIDDVLNRLKNFKYTAAGDSHLLGGLLKESRGILASLDSAVEQGQLNPSGKHGKGMADVMERILRSYRQISRLVLANNDTLPCFPYCQEALGAMSKWNLNFRHAHYEHAIVVASGEERWKEASDLFFEKIDPGAGYNPVQVSTSNPEGLYAIARRAQQENSPVAELVFDAVLQLSMVSPQDQTTYILAAGTALGKAGEWASAVDFLHSSYTANQLGQPLTASVMYSCLLSGRPEEALRIYEEKYGDVGEKRIAEEWQWGGNRDTLDPLTRDLLIRTVGARPGLSSLALDLFQETIDEGRTISLEALLALFEACENDGNIEGSLSVMDHILENASRDNWIVSGSDLVIVDCEHEDAKRLSGGTVASRWLAEMSDHMAAVLRCCNSVSSFGTGLFYLQRMDLLIPKDRSQHSMPKDKRSLTSTAESLANMLSSLRWSETLLIPTMVALCGLKCYDDAVRLVDLLDDGQSLKASNLREYAVNEMSKNGTIMVGNPWTSADRHIHRLLAAICFIQKSGVKLRETDESKILRGLAAAMRSCTSANNADLSLRLLSYIALSLHKIRGHVASKSDYGDWSHLALANDALTAEIINALCSSNKVLDAVELFRVLLEHKPSDLSHWRSSCSAGLSAIVNAGRGDEAVQIFHEMHMTTISPDCYVQIGKYLFSMGKTKELEELYTAALNSGNLSDELTLMTMSSVVNSKTNNRVRILRAMVDDSAKCVGVDREVWMRTRYWQVKKALGFHNARLLMWWNDPETCHLDELEFAISDFNARVADGVKVRNDAVRTIVKHAGSFNESKVPHANFRWKHFVPRNKDECIALVLNVVRECESSAIMNDPFFIESVVGALCNLDGKKECVDYVTILFNRDIRVQRSTLSRALEAATIVQDVAVSNDIRMLISDFP